VLKRIWHLFGSVKVTFYLLLVIAFSFALGSYYVKYNPQIFKHLSNSLFQDWFSLHGQYYPEKIWWLVMLLLSLFALGINICVCTLNRLMILFSNRKQMSNKIFLLKITPSLTHICFLVMLSGHLLSMISGYNAVLPVEAGVKTSLPTQAEIDIQRQNCEYYISPEALKGSMEQCTIALELQMHGETTQKQISFLHPLYWHGYSFHVGMDKRSSKSPELTISIKRDPGARLILFGFTVLILLMLWYFPQINRGVKNSDKEVI
jgi:hypothetical protein